ncbi:MAG: SDR family oxidoreductase [Flavobacteriales bacterium]|nr:SDR family oxidoreductase [Flavobacteriales bacterium]
MTASSTSTRKLIVVTGATKGIGRAIARALVQEHGCEVLAIGRTAGELASLQDELSPFGDQLRTLVVDLAQPGSEVVVQQELAGRRVHGLVNNAGLLITRPFGHWSQDDMSQLFNTNVFAPIRLVQALVHAMDGDPAGHVVNIGSMGGFQGSSKFPGLLAYSASKAALANATECLAEELKDRQVRVNCLSIGAVDTAMLQAAFPGYRAPVGAESMGTWIARFVLEGHNLFNGKVLPVSSTTP